jgi:FkbM family methyltransferase
LQHGVLFANLFVSFLFFWHGKLRLRGAGRLLSFAAIWNSHLQSFKFQIPAIGELTIDFRDRSNFCWTAYLSGHPLAEHVHLAVISRYLQPGQVFWDVGANVGLISALVLENNPSVQIVAIEPNPSLACNLKLLFERHKRVTVLSLALSNNDGTGSFFIPAGATFNGSLQRCVHESGEFVKVRLSRGDSLLDELSELPPPSFIKIDAEGHEPSIFCGLEGIIRKHSPVIIFEHHHLSDQQVIDMTPNGYTRLSIHKETGELLPGIDRSRSVDSILIPIRSEKTRNNSTGQVS